MRTPLRTCLPLLLLAGLAAAPMRAEAAPRSISIALIGEDGVPREPLDATDFQVSLSRSTEQTGLDAGTQASLSLEFGTLANPAMLAWMAAPGEAGGALITVTTTHGTMVYLLSQVTTRALSISHMTSNMDGNISLSLGAKHLSVNGNTVN